MSNQHDHDRLMADPAEFRRALLIDCDGMLRPLAEVADDWQLRDYEATDKGWLQVATGRGIDGAVKSAYLERPRGHSKTTDLAVQSAFALFAAAHKVSGVVAAADQDQARLLIEKIDRLCRDNAFLGDVLEVQRNRVVNKHTGSELVVLASDADSSYGLTPDFVLIDELTHWKAAGEALWHALYSASAKRARCMLVIISNAGVGRGSSWQWFVREAARLSENWYFSRLDGPVARWITPANLAEQMAMLPALVSRRVWGNEWTQGTSDALTVEQIEQAITMAGPEPYNSRGVYVAGLDLGLTHDCAALVVVGKFGLRYRVARCWEWRPTAGIKVSIDAVEAVVIAASREYRISQIGADPWQAAQLVERCKKQGVHINERYQHGATLTEQASALIENYTAGAVDMYDFPPLVRDLKRLNLKEMSYGYRIVSTKGPDGHGDTCTALSIALAIAKTASGGGSWGGVINPGGRLWEHNGGYGGAGPSNPHRPNEIQYLEGRYGKFF